MRPSWIVSQGSPQGGQASFAHAKLFVPEALRQEQHIEDKAFLWQADLVLQFPVLVEEHQFPRSEIPVFPFRQLGNTHAAAIPVKGHAAREPSGFQQKTAL